jgi:hypothetical protein
MLNTERLRLRNWSRSIVGLRVIALSTPDGLVVTADFTESNSISGGSIGIPDDFDFATAFALVVAPTAEDDSAAPEILVGGGGGGGKMLLSLPALHALQMSPH